MEAEVGIEPAYTELQSAAWPLCHPAKDCYNSKNKKKCKWFFYKVAFLGFFLTQVSSKVDKSVKIGNIFVKD